MDKDRYTLVYIVRITYYNNVFIFFILMSLFIRIACSKTTKSRPSYLVGHIDKNAETPEKGRSYVFCEWENDP